MKAANQLFETFVFLLGPLLVNWWEFDNRYPVTAIFVGIVLAGLLAEIRGARELTLKVHKMVWDKRFPGEPWE